MRCQGDFPSCRYEVGLGRFRILKLFVFGSLRYFFPYTAVYSRYLIQFTLPTSIERIITLRSYNVSTFQSKPVRETRHLPHPVQGSAPAPISPTLVTRIDKRHDVHRKDDDRSLPLL